MYLLNGVILSFALLLGQQVEKAPFRIAIAAENQTVTAGEDVWIKVSITNLSKQNLDDSGGIRNRTRIDPNLLFEVRDETGKPVPKRIYSHPELDTGSPVNRSIAPGETFTEEQSVNALYEMRKPGKYVIQVSPGL
jgi:uncharacterized membrane protein